ncbi:MAG TPA: glycosyltransferase family 4 protein [Bdellovibrionota bacterium]|nr:glycosyltransferase family 4 protein [Bdellovibrionota bacterium]
MRLAYICSNPTYRLDVPSGYATHIRELSTAFQEIGIDVSTHLPQKYSGPGVISPGVRSHRLRGFVPTVVWEGLKDLRRLNSDRSFAHVLRREFKLIRPDVVYERIDYSGGAASSVAKIFRSRYVLEIHAPLDEEARTLSGPRPFWPWFRHRIWHALRAADRIVVVSGVIRDWLQSNGVEAAKVVVISNGVNLEQFDPKRAEPSKNPPMKKPSELWIGFVGSDLVWYRLETLVDAFSRIPPEMNARLMIVGPAFRNVALRAHVDQSSAIDRIYFSGNVPHTDVPGVIMNFDICVMPATTRYCSPIKLFEYGAMDKAVIVPDEAPVREVVEAEKEAILIRSGDVEQLAGALIRLARDPKLRQRLGQNLGQRVRSQYSWIRVAKKIASEAFGGLK